MKELFKSQPINQKGVEKLEMIKIKFSELHKEVLKYIRHEEGARHKALFETHLEMASLWAFKALESDTQNHPREGR